MRSQVWQAFSLLYGYPAFGRLWVGRSISLFGDAFTLIALPWFVLQVTDSGTATAGILLSLQLPAILTSMAIGSLIDRFQPRAIITIDNGPRTLIIGTIPDCIKYRLQLALSMLKRRLQLRPTGIKSLHSITHWQ